MSIRLPRDPKKDAYEDLVSAALTAYGYFVETRLILKKDGTEVLEFDTVATPASASQYGNPVLVEVKSGKCGIADMFKLYGQAMFTEFPRAWLVHKVDFKPDKRGAIETVQHGTCVEAKHVTVEPLLDPELYPLPLATEVAADLRHAVLEIAWWARLADRVVQSKFISWRKGFGKTPPDEVEMAKQYDMAVVESFFKKGPVRRASALYDAYKASPKLTNTLAEFHAEGVTGLTAKQVVQATWNGPRYPWLQHIMMTEHRARIRLIKLAYDIRLGGNDAVGGPAKVTKSALNWDWDMILEMSLPQSFRTGMTKLESHPTPKLVPYFFQVFMEVFGGFYFPGDDDDVQLLAGVTGMAPEQVRPTLDLFDDFFPTRNGWILDGNKGLVLFKAMPAIVRGAGCFFRNSVHALAKYEDRYKGNHWHMEAWHNALYAVLEPSLKVKSE